MPKLKDLDKFKNAKGLVETTDSQSEKPLYRRSGFEGIVSFETMDERISSYLTNAREHAGISRADFAAMIGLATAVYGRYERAESRMTVTRMIHLCELLDILPIDIISVVAPHLYGRTPEEAKDYVELTHIIRNLPHDTVRDLMGLLKRMTPDTTASDQASNG
ncbi:transcriptional regulator [Rhizobium wenxiniae]|uniref:Transcriptional regulator with XRE-family HTH domain n=1 Tax=Rhizobium wenxiniae TaxID=1737357 RepID=A0A7W9YAR6_9HYPH|nr:helix-turn-helix transcriptional regulator [Rhizobium wenxiniae]MBB6165135.1 transcriptional regulator with XRE-family HTH domain [Rhizobium wenxiniae]GGG13021.1 transcriptional regulator [Rhizobium wenxiniae]